VKAHILLVEDDLRMRRALDSWLKRAGYQVTQVADGETAVELLEAETFEVVVTDMVMGDVDGIEVLHTARIQPYRPQVILLTGHGTLETAISAFRQGAFDYLLKPCDDDDLLTTIERALQQHHSEHQLMDAATTLFPSMHHIHNNKHPPPDTSTPIPELPLVGQPVRPPATQPPPQPAPIFFQPITIGLLSLGPTRHEVVFRGKPVRLTPIEYAIIQYLAQTPGLVCRSKDIVRHSHGLITDEPDAQALVRPHIYNLRRKLAADYLVTDRGAGYMLVAPLQEESN
jgi:DNA-binding response OmpR family regulator